jgi:hypothetical protein
MRDLGYPDIGKPQTAAVADDVTPPVEGDAGAGGDAPAEDG